MGIMDRSTVMVMNKGGRVYRRRSEDRGKREEGGESEGGSEEGREEVATFLQLLC